MDGHTSGQMTSSGRGRHLAGHKFVAAFSFPISPSLASVGGFFAGIFYLRCRCGCGFVPDANTRARFVASSLRHLFCSILFKLRLYLLSKSNCRVVEFLVILFCRALTRSRWRIHRIAHFCGTPIGAELLFVCANVCRWPTSLGKR